jgi:hypothetical protein
MGILSNIFHKIFPASHPAVAQAPQGTMVPPPAPTEPQAPQPASQPQAPTAVQMTEVDVEAILNDKAKTAGQPLNWRTSIVDLLKLLDLDSSLQARKQLAQELHYSGDMENSASMNVWLHRQVMNKLAQNGGKVPDDLKD